MTKNPAFYESPPVVQKPDGSGLCTTTIGFLVREGTRWRAHQHRHVCVLPAEGAASIIEEDSVQCGLWMEVPEGTPDAQPALRTSNSPLLLPLQPAYFRSPKADESIVYLTEVK